MSIELIVPVGTSALGWIRRAGLDIVFPEAWLGMNAARAAAVGDPPEPEAVFAELRPLLAGPDRASAEIDSIRAWLERRDRGPSEIAKVVLLASDSDEGRWCGALTHLLLANLLDSGRDLITVRQVGLRTQLDDSGTRAFVGAIADIVRSATAAGRQPVINATAGLKAESGLALLVGQLMGAEVFYLHERMQTPLVFRPLGLQLQLDSEAVHILRTLGDAAERDDVRDLGLGRRTDLWAHVTHEDGLWALSALGQLALEALGVSNLDVVLPDREGEGEVHQKRGEEGHAPKDQGALGEQILASCPFVRVAQVVGWKGAGTPGLRVPREGDAAAGIVRVQLRTREKDRRLVRFLLRTTALSAAGVEVNPLVWSEARARVAAAFGRVALGEELEEQAQEVGVGIPDFAQLDHETALLKLNARLVQAQEGAEKEAAEAREQVAKAKERERKLRTELRRMEEKAKRSAQRAEGAERLARELEQDIRRLSAASAEAEPPPA